MAASELMIERSAIEVSLSDAAHHRYDQGCAGEPITFRLDLLRLRVGIFGLECGRDRISGGPSRLPFKHDEAPGGELAVIRHPGGDREQRIDFRGGRGRAGEFDGLERSPGGQKFEGVDHVGRSFFSYLQ